LVADAAKKEPEKKDKKKEKHKDKAKKGEDSSEPFEEVKMPKATAG